MMFWLVAAALIAATAGLMLAGAVAIVFGALAAATFIFLAAFAVLLVCVALALASRTYVRNAEARWPAEGRFVDVGGARVHIREAGPEDAPRVLLVHGANANLRELWGLFADDLSRDFRVIAMDRPGLGYSTRPRDGRKLATQAKIIAAVLRETGGRAIVVGHSFGAAVALRTALDAPDLVAGLVLIAPASHPYAGKPIWWVRLSASPVLGPLFAGLFIPNLGPAMARANIGRNFAPGAPPENYYDSCGVGLAFRPSAFRASATDVRGLSAELGAQAPRYPEIFAPVIIVTAEKDKVLSPKRHARALAADLPSAELVIAPDTGHMPHQLRPDLVLAAIRRVNAMAGAPAQS